MASRYYEHKIMESVREKRKYFSKVLSLNAMDTNYDRVRDTEDWFIEWSWRYGLPFIWLDIHSLFIFGLQPYELEPFNIDFRIELPSVEEWLQGIKLKFEKVDLGELWKQFNEEIFQEIVPPQFDFDTFVSENILEEFQTDISNLLNRKLIVGKTKYGEGYVDPPVIREFLRASFYEIFRRRPDYERLKKVFETISQKLDIHEGIVESVFNRIVMHDVMIKENFILGYNILGYSKLSPRGKHSSKFPTLTWRGEVFNVEYTKLEEPNAGFILGVTPLGFGVLIPRKSIWKPTKIGVTPKIVWFIDYKMRHLHYRYRATHLGFANYQKHEEMYKYYKSERADQYHSLRTFIYHIESLVENLLEGKGIDQFRLNMYKRAVLQLIGHKKKRHRWGYGAYESMTDEEFKEYWIDYWVKQGLDKNTLVNLYNSVSKWLPHLRYHMKELGESIRKKREQLAKLLS
ncbi:MAG: hypothetical protein DRP11_01445 [Candidatus Aenigmatarchaeota archaeon]|nr:MAG: hypothetical protein DRP11_01445 [Candidatus Aenigmarchaeota archaeon]